MGRPKGIMGYLAVDWRWRRRRRHAHAAKALLEEEDAGAQEATPASMAPPRRSSRTESRVIVTVVESRRRSLRCRLHRVRPPKRKERAEAEGKQKEPTGSRLGRDGREKGREKGEGIR